MAGEAMHPASSLLRDIISNFRPAFRTGKSPSLDE
ncbi:uncharacterized protein METZ01_LOCUS393605, partial [marine metagenome]